MKETSKQTKSLTVSGGGDGGGGNNIAKALNQHNVHSF